MLQNYLLDCIGKAKASFFKGSSLDGSNLYDCLIVDVWVMAILVIDWQGLK